MGRSDRSALKRIACPEKLLEFFDLEIRNIDYTSRYLDLDTSKGKLQLIPTDQDERSLVFLYRVQLHLKANGFKNISVFYQSREADPFIKYRRKLMILVDQVDGEEFIYTRENIVKAMQTLAEFHNAARGLDPVPGSEFKVSWGKWPERCFQEINDLIKQKLLMKEQRGYRFDDIFVEQVDRLIERGLKAWQRFNHENYRQILEQEMEDRAFNLHSYKADKLTITNGQIQIKDMQWVRYELQVYDLAYFLNEILKETVLPVDEVVGFIDEYTKIRQLPAREREALLAFLLYPKDLYRLIRHNYRNQKLRDDIQGFGQLINLMNREEELITHLERYS